MWCEPKIGWPRSDAQTLTNGISDMSLVCRDDLRHSVTYELGWRTLTDPSRRAAREVQQHFGHSLKSSVIYTFRHSHWPTGYVSRGGHAWR